VDNGAEYKSIVVEPKLLVQSAPLSIKERPALFRLVCPASCDTMATTVPAFGAKDCVGVQNVAITKY
jgi:hypothetical protein